MAPHPCSIKIVEHHPLETRRAQGVGGFRSDVCVYIYIIRSLIVKRMLVLRMVNVLAASART